MLKTRYVLKQYPQVNMDELFGRHSHNVTGRAFKNRTVFDLQSHLTLESESPNNSDDDSDVDDDIM
jgi:hypothetical protein